MAVVLALGMQSDYTGDDVSDPYTSGWTISADISINAERSCDDTWYGQLPANIQTRAVELREG
jgi:hypothetical protein